MNSLKQLAGQTVIYGVSSILGRLLNYLLVPLHVYIFTDPGEYGVVGELYAWVSLLIVLLMYGLETAFFRYNELNENKNTVFGTAFISILVTSALFITAAFIFLEPIAEVMKYESNPEYIKWFSIIIVMDVLSTIPFARLRSQNRAKRFALIKIAGIISNVLLNLFFLLFCPWLLQYPEYSYLITWFYDPSIGIGYIFLANLFSSLITFLLLIPVIHFRDIQFRFSLWKEMVSYAFPLLIFGLAGIINETMDRILIKNLSEPATAMAQVGIYSACYKISIMMTIFIQAFKYAAEPFFFSKAKDADAKDTYSQVMTYFVATCSLIFLAIMLYMDIVKHFVSAAYQEGLGVVPILLLANLFLGIFFNLSVWYKITGQTRFGAYISIFGATTTLILNYMLIPKMGYMGAAWTTLICYAAMMVLSYLLSQKYYFIKYNFKKVFGYLFLALGIYYGSTFIPEIEKTTNLAINTVLLLIYISILFLIERKSIGKIIQDKQEINTEN
ncbi:MAG: polysaccharide biosynthesis C-terminal domain-containing protein [Bacteroidales bacterium]|nr:polysaccharide biosynthesis C-terminal domain-containing protein [Bacteroidales bacterium]MDD4575543.1 polysaccharide biosynthesis C-terminal domain-containing protein [Bacteroidales bacterium]